MAKFELVMPKMGESIMEATILNWVKQEGDEVDVDDTIVEIATDKVDSEVPSPVAGKIEKILFQENDTVEIGKVIAILQTEGEESAPSPASSEDEPEDEGQASTDNGQQEEKSQRQEKASPATAETKIESGSGSRFYSPLVRNIAEKEGISLEELEQIPGTGASGRVTKRDILAYVEDRGVGTQPEPQVSTTDPQPRKQAAPEPQQRKQSPTPPSTVQTSNGTQSAGGNTEIVEMDRMRRMIAAHMVDSKRTSPHVTSFVEVDVTNIVAWRNGVKVKFQERYNEKITFTPIFIEAVVKSLRDFPMVNVSVKDDSQIIVKKDLNIGMATALPTGNLIVPVIRHADQLNLVGLAKQVNGLAKRARANQLRPEEIQDGTFTITNVGTFGNVMGTPIINQPQAAILATGAIRKKPAVMETEYGDVIAVRHMMYLSLSYDHRVVDGFLGGSFLRRIGDYLEAFDKNRDI